MEPKLVTDLWDELDPSKQLAMTSVYASGNYCYALQISPELKSNQLYSWGMGSSYVLGTRDEENEYRPYKVHPKMFEEFPVREVALGTQHVVVLTSNDLNRKDIPEFEDEVLNFALPVVVKIPTLKKVGTPRGVKPMMDTDKKRKRDEFENKEEEKKEELPEQMIAK